MGSTAAIGQSVDLSHHINQKSRSRHPSPLKDIIKLMGVEGMVSLAGGLPHPSLFPIAQATFQAPPCLPSLTETGQIDTNATDNQSFTLGRGSLPGDVDLGQFLQYGSGTGNKQLLVIARQLTDRVHSPPYADYEVLLHPGNTNAWAKIVGLLCEDNDFVMVEEYTYPSAQAFWVPLGIKAAPISSDAEGIRADSLRDMLANWDEGVRGARRPTVLYLVTVGSNPTGVTISRERSKGIYDICVEFDVIIVEDDPYYFLQYPPYQPDTPAVDPQLPTDDFLASLTPSILSLDTQGRVIRLESFSKTLFPALRLGYFVANPIFTERLLRATEVDTQDPAGLSQAFTLGLINSWGGIDGFLGWMQVLRTQYRVRRDWLLGAFSQHFEVLAAADSPLPGEQGSVVCLRVGAGGGGGGGDRLVPVFSFVDPTAGMFVWAEFYFAGVTRFKEIAGGAGADKGTADPEQVFAEELWAAWANELVLLTPGYYYHPWQGKDKTTTAARGAKPQTAHFRFSFATPSKEQIELAVERLKKVISRYWI